MATMIPFRLGKDYTIRFDTLAKRIGLKRPFLVRNLLSFDPILIDDIEAKAKTLNTIDIYDTAMQNDKKYEKVPDVITIRLDEEQEHRFNALVASLGAGTKVQVLRNLLSGDPGTVATICKKAKSLALAPHTQGEFYAQTGVNEATDAIEKLVRRKVSEFERELRIILAKQKSVSVDEGEMLIREEVPSVKLSSISRQTVDSQVQTNLIPDIQGGGEQSFNKSKRGRPKKVPSGVDHSEERKQIIDYFNLKAGRNLGSDSIESIKAIDKMLDKGKPVSEFLIIINNQCYWWRDVHPDMYSNLFPETIFRPSNWARYLANTPSQPT
jgi:uncharacterized phage protein (TIGR02220 family)